MLLLLTVALAALGADAWTRSPAVTFGTLPSGVTSPEGISPSTPSGRHR